MLATLLHQFLRSACLCANVCVCQGTLLTKSSTTSNKSLSANAVSSGKHCYANLGILLQCCIRRNTRLNSNQLFFFFWGGGEGDVNSLCKYVCMYTDMHLSDKQKHGIIRSRTHLDGLGQHRGQLSRQLCVILVPCAMSLPRHRVRDPHAQQVGLELDSLQSKQEQALTIRMSQDRGPSLVTGLGIPMLSR